MNIEEFKKLKETYKNAIKKEGKKLFTEQFKNLFDQSPELVEVQWVQYVPHFNDNNAYIFRVHDFSYLFSDFSESEKELYEEEPYELTVSDFDPDRKYGKPNSTASKERYELLTEFEKMPLDEDVFQEIFGSDCKVIASKDKKGEIKFAVEEYEHD